MLPRLWFRPHATNWFLIENLASSSCLTTGLLWPQATGDRTGLCHTGCRLHLPTVLSILILRWTLTSGLNGPKDIVAGAVGKGAAAEFTGFLDLWDHLPLPLDIISDPDGIPVPDNPAVLFALSEMMGAAMTLENITLVMAWARRLPPEFSVLLMREAVRKTPRVVETADFADWASMNAQILV